MRSRSPAVAGASARHGHALVEALSVLATLGALLLVAGALFRLAARTAAVAGDRAEAADAVRTTASLLDRELRPLAPHDLVVTADSVSLRVFRGVAVPCDSAAGALRVRWSGVRLPDPTKDSVLALSLAGERAVALSAAVAAGAPAPCVPAPDETALLLTTAAPLPAATLLLVFERGAYSLGRGLRYRRGLGGRQPVTADAFDPATTRFVAAAAGTAVDVALGAAGPPGFGLPARPRIPLANADTLP